MELSQGWYISPVQSLFLHSFLKLKPVFLGTYMRYV